MCVCVTIYTVKITRHMYNNNRTVLRTIDECTLTVNMCKGTEDSARTIASLLHVIAFSRLVDLRMELLFRTCVTIRARIALFAVTWFTPFFAVFHVRARR